MNRFIGLNKPLLVAPHLRQNDMGIYVLPSKYDGEKSSTLPARDHRRIVSAINALLFACFDSPYFAVFAQNYNIGV